MMVRSFLRGVARTDQRLHAARGFLADIEDSNWFAPIYLTANTGMRRGELLGLTWRSVDLDAARLVVDQQLLSVGYEPEIGAPKTSTSRRTIRVYYVGETVRSRRESAPARRHARSASPS